ncbi:phosphoenolpyruvate carboxykinase [GTP], mitochondrial [Hydra vulgaris]|uniref:phosphoenolpyruvate carboxykinase [GTP], mitochondrial n=1 Tax=Hydra vulgaris TaxID=6087 RepID=UPI000640E87B|nr:phosphoenolpyruvate carboxykinase [GTP], mitochondrial [Hydra vulgaris]
MALLPADVAVTWGKFEELPEKVKVFVVEKVQLCTPVSLHICDGSSEDGDFLINLLLQEGTAVKLEKFKNCYAVRTNPADVARVESRTIICTKNQHDTLPSHKVGIEGHLGYWADTDEEDEKLRKLFNGCMKGRTMYLLPFSMGPLGSPLSKPGIQLTDSPYVALCMRIMTRLGSSVLASLGEGDFIKCLHSVGQPLPVPADPYHWPCNPEQTVIAHFPERREIMSFGSGYGGNSLLGKKCFALRIGSVIARDEGWLAEHMMILSLTNPQGEKKYIAAAFPSQCGKTNLAMITPSIPGWKAECVGDDIAWMKFDEEGVLRAINPEYGFFGVAPGTSKKTNRVAEECCAHDTVFTNIATTSDGGYYWEGLEEEIDLTGLTVTDWLGKPWTPGCGKPAAHPNSRFCSPSRNCPMMDPNWEDPKGVPISAIMFGGRRPEGVPLIYEALSWQHGVFIASSMCSEATSAAEHSGKTVMRDPFAMRPFFGYNAGHYFKHWLSMNKEGRKLPKIFHVNWFRKNAEGRFLWPGFGENIRVLSWICDRVDNKDVAVESPVGLIPKEGSIDISGLGDIDMAELMSTPKAYWLEQLNDLQKYYEDEFLNDLPTELWDEFKSFKQRIEQLP